MDKKSQLPVYGVGPAYVIIIITLTIVGFLLNAFKIIKDLKIEILRIPFFVIGILFIFLGIVLWERAVFESKIDNSIKNKKLVTTGVYKYVRNPIYSAFMIVCTGVLLLTNNLCLLFLPPFYWMILTILMKNTEEKWLKNMYGNDYIEYCKRVNRCIPWIYR